MASGKKKKKTPTWFLYGLVAVMVAVFVAQMIFPTNLGKIFDKCVDNPVQITVTVVSEKNKNISYQTDSEDEMAEFMDWARKKTARNRSLADGVSADRQNKTEYNFAIKDEDGNYSAIVIDERGFVHSGAELYKVSEDAEIFLQELKNQLEAWK